MKLNKLFIKLVIFLASIYLIQLLLNIFIWPTSIYQYTLLPNGFFPFTKSNFLKAGIFAVFAFILYHRKGLLQLENHKISLKQTASFLLLSLVSIPIYYIVRAYIKINLDYFSGNKTQALALIAIPLVLFVASLFLAIFNIKFTQDLLNKFKKTIPIFFSVGVLYYFIALYFQKLWPFFSKVVAVSAKGFFSLFYPTKIVLQPSGPFLTINNFKAIIGAPCSGIDSMLLFSTLYFLIFFLDFKKLKKKTMLLLFIPGVAGMFLFNLLRIFLLLLIGLYISPDFAVGLFHQNIGWLLFVVYFILFYMLTRRLIYKSR